MLDGLRVIDLSGEGGWLAGRLLADLGADVVKVEAPGREVAGADWQAWNVNKRLLRLDIEAPAGSEALDALLARADLLIETAAPGSEQAARFDLQRLARLNPALVQLSISAFGRTGPRAGWLASDLELMAAGGAMSLAGEPGGTPLRVSVPQARGWAGAQGAVGALLALVHRGETGVGQHVDVSAQAAVLAALAHAPTFADLRGEVPTRSGAFVSGRALSGARFRAFWPCADGHLNFVLYGGAAGRRSGEQLVAWMREDGADPAALADVDWGAFDPKRLTQQEVDLLEAPIGRFFASLRKPDFLRIASAREMLGYPVSTMADIAGDPQLAARGFWQDLPTAEGGVARHCGAFARIDGARAPLRHAPGTEVALDELLALWRTDPLADQPAPARQARAAGTIRPQALAGLRVVEYASYAAGPAAGKLLANHGATVLHVESRARPDGFRLEYPPFKDDLPGIDRGGCFAYFNDSKLGITLELKTAAGLALARRIVAQSDVVIENMRPGVMQRLGLGWETLRAINPQLIMLSSCNMGQTGPRANTPGFGSQLSALAGFCGLTGEPDGLPTLLYGPYIDFIASTLGAAAILAALNRRQRSGQGAWIDLAQYEAGLLFVAGPLLEQQRSGRSAERCGNADPVAAPHGAFRCRDEGWLALSCWSEGERARLASALGWPDLLSAGAGRSSQAQQLQPAIASWCLEREADAAAAVLQQAGVHAHRVNTVADLFADPQLRHRRVWQQRRHPVIGPQRYCRAAFELSATPGDVGAAAPCLGADNESVMRDIVGLDAAQLAAARSAGAFGTEPPPAPPTAETAAPARARSDLHILSPGECHEQAC